MNKGTQAVGARGARFFVSDPAARKALRADASGCVLPCFGCPHRDGMICDESCEWHAAYLELERQSGRQLRVLALVALAVPIVVALVLLSRCGR